MLAASMICAPSAVAIPDSPDAELQVYLDQMEELGKFATDIRGSIDRSSFDTYALIDSLDFELDQIIAFVRTSISFEQYPGVLRGPQGTLMSRSGNAVDQALLLAKLLGDAGYDARIVRGALNDESAGILLSQMQRPPARLPPAGDAERALAAYVSHGLIEPGDEEAKAAIDSIFSGRASVTDESVHADVRATTALIEQKLSQGGITFERTGGQADLLAEARDYFWVQVKESAADPWRNVHPALDEEAPLADMVPSETFADTIPEALLHRVRVQFFLERAHAGTLEQIAISEPWERPVANLLETPVTIGVLPDTMLGSDSHGFDLESAVAAASYFAPIMNGSIAPGAKFFNSHGSIIDPLAMSSPAASIFDTVQDAFIGAAEGMGAEQLPAITAQWVEFTLISPTDGDQVHRRMAVDFLGPAARASNTLPEKTRTASSVDLKPMIQRQTLMINAGRTPRGMVMDRSLRRFADSIPLLTAVTRSLFDPEQINGLAQSLQDAPVSWPGHLELFTALDEADLVSAEHHIYRSGPALIIHRSGFFGAQGSLEGIDIVSNPRRAIPRSGEVVHDPSALVAAGVWETQLEGTVLHDTNEVMSTGVVFSEARQHKVPLVLLKPDDRMELKISGDAMQHLNADLDRGFAVLTPASDEELSRIGWWRIDLTTGETLGMLDDGRGSAITEALIEHSAAISQAFLVVGLFGCLKEAHQSGGQEGGGRQAACCVGAQFLFYGVGMVGGAVVPGVGFLRGGEGLLRASKAYLAYASVLWDSVSSLLSVCE